MSELDAGDRSLIADAHVATTDSVSGFAVSEDGAWLAYLTDSTGAPQPWIVPTDGSSAPRHLAVAGTVTRCVWRPDGQRLLVQVDAEGAELYSLYEIDRHTGAVKVIASAPNVRHELGVPYASFGNPYSPDGRALAYASNARDETSFDVIVRDLETGEERTALQAGDELAADRYLPIYFSPDSRRLLVLRLRQHTEHDLFVCRLDDGTVELVTPHDGPTKYLPAAWTDEGIYLCTTSRSDFLGLALLAAEVDLHWLDQPPHDVVCGAASGDGRHLFWAVSEEGYCRLHHQDLTTGVRTELTGLPAGVCAQDYGYDGQSLQPTRDGRLFVLLGTPTAAPQVWELDARTGRARALTAAGPAQSAEPYLVPETVRFTSADGLCVSALLYQPPGAGLKPVVVHVHGGPEAQAFPMRDPLIAALLEQGIGVLAPNIRARRGLGCVISG